MKLSHDSVILCNYVMIVLYYLIMSYELCLDTEMLSENLKFFFVVKNYCLHIMFQISL